VGLTIDVAANTREAQRGVKDLSTAFDGVADALDDVANDAEKGGDRVERSFRDMARAAKDAGRDGASGVGKLDDALDKAERQAKRTERAVDDIGDAKGFGKMKDAAQEVTQEVGQNLGEAVSSVRGNLADLGQVGQDTLGGLAATIAGTGPGGIAGAAALAAGAVGLGLVTAELTKQQEEAEQLRERLSNAYKEAAESGAQYLDTAAIISNASDLMFNKDRADEWKNVQSDANKLGLDLNTVIRANAGDLDSQRDVQERINALIQDENSYHAQGSTNAKTLNGDVSDMARRWKDVTVATDEAKSKADQLRSVTSDMLMGLVNSASDAQAGVDELGNRLVTFRGEHGEEKVFINAQTGEATRAVDQFRGDADGVIDHVNGRDIVLQARAAVDQAQRDINRYISDNDGRSFTVYGRVKVDSGAMP